MEKASVRPDGGTSGRTEARSARAMQPAGAGVFPTPHGGRTDAGLRHGLAGVEDYALPRQFVKS